MVCVVHCPGKSSLLLFPFCYCLLQISFFWLSFVSVSIPWIWNRAFWVSPSDSSRSLTSLQDILCVLTFLNALNSYIHAYRSLFEDFISLFICHFRSHFFAVKVDGCLQRNICWSTYFPSNQSVHVPQGL